MKYLTPYEVAGELSCSLDHVYDLIRAGVLRAVDISRPGAKRRTYRVPASALETLPLAGAPEGPVRGRESAPARRAGSGFAGFYKLAAEIRKEAREKSKALRPPGSHVSGTKGIEITPEAENPVSRPGAGLVASAGTITGDEEAPNAP